MSDVSISIIGNCQVRPMSDFLACMLPDANISPGFTRELASGEIDLHALLKNDLIIVQSVMKKKVLKALNDLNIDKSIVLIPTIYFSGFHPDFIYATGPNGNVSGPLGTANSSIALSAWKSGLSVASTARLFNDRTYRYLGFHDYLAKAKFDFLSECAHLNLEIQDEYDAWERAGPFVHVPNHPKSFMIAGLSRALLRKLRYKPAIEYPEFLFSDNLASSLVWPIYPELVPTVGGYGSYLFKPASGKRGYGDRLKVLDLNEFIEASFDTYSQFEKDEISSVRLNDKRYQEMISINEDKSVLNGLKRTHPYQGLPSYQFWRKSVSNTTIDEFDPVTNPKTVISTHQRVATAGSCFAQHIARHLSMSGFNYYVPEDGEHLSQADKFDRQYGLFSCRYGNIYTAAQLNQLFDRSEGTFEPKLAAWKRSDDRFVDPFRPTVEPNGYISQEEMIEETRKHLLYVHKMWRSLDVFVFTLGLTEAWRTVADLAVIPLAPGVVAGEPNPKVYEFHNFDVAETVLELTQFIEKLRAVNNTAKVILTVSPVPLEATYEDRNVLVSTTYSKAVLRASAEMICSKFDFVEYFPSFEIITGNYNRGAYFADDLRDVLPIGVEHVMRLFKRHHTDGSSEAADLGEQERLEGQGVICDEELLGSE